jgi:hypothetical protein
MMGTYKMFTDNHMGWILIAVILVLFAQASISHGAGQLLSWPIDGAVTQSKSNTSLKSYEVRKGQISLAQELLPSPAGVVGRQTGIAASKGNTDTVLISLFADVVYEVTIDSVKHHADGTMIISGKLKDHKIGTVVMTIGPDRFLITVQDMNRSMLYRVTGDSRLGSGTVAEIDSKKMPPMIR